MTIEQHRARLAKLETALDDAIATAASFSHPGAQSVTNHSLDVLRTQIAIERRIIRRLQGYSVRRSLPDFSC